MDLLCLLPSFLFLLRRPKSGPPPSSLSISSSPPSSTVRGAEETRSTDLPRKRVRKSPNTIFCQLRPLRQNPISTLHGIYPRKAKDRRIPPHLSSSSHQCGDHLFFLFPPGAFPLLLCSAVVSVFLLFVCTADFGVSRGAKG